MGVCVCLCIRVYLCTRSQTLSNILDRFIYWKSLFSNESCDDVPSNHESCCTLLLLLPPLPLLLLLLMVLILVSPYSARCVIPVCGVSVTRSSLALLHYHDYIVCSAYTTLRLQLSNNGMIPLHNWMHGTVTYLVNR